jgi:hypothetical protein
MRILKKFDGKIVRYKQLITEKGVKDPLEGV